MPGKRLAAAMAAYSVLIGIALYRLQGKLLYAVLLLFAALIAKTVIAAKAGWFISERPDSRTDSKPDFLDEGEN